jgi:protein-disulfide isomerase
VQYHLALGALLTLTPLLCTEAQDTEKRNPATASLQQQIDELKIQQQRILNELEELRAQLQSAPKRADYPVRPVPATNITLGVAGELFRGAPDARIAIMEYSDFDCSYCARFANEIYLRIDSEYIKPGKVKFFFRDLPAPEHTNSFYKARAARCAGEQGLFWEMHDYLFARSPQATAAEIEDQAKALGLDVAQYQGCVESDRFTSNIQRSIAGARRMGLQGTPAFLIGRLDPEGTTVHVADVILGAESYELFRNALDKLLKATNSATEQKTTAQPN